MLLEYRGKKSFQWAFYWAEEFVVAQSARKYTRQKLEQCEASLVKKTQGLEQNKCFRKQVQTGKERSLWSPVLAEMF